jgi:hypothetical protein
MVSFLRLWHGDRDSMYFSDLRRLCWVRGHYPETGFSEMFKPKLSHHRGSLNRVPVHQ